MMRTIKSRAARGPFTHHKASQKQSGGGPGLLFPNLVIAPPDAMFFLFDSGGTAVMM